MGAEVIFVTNLGRLVGTITLANLASAILQDDETTFHVRPSTDVYSSSYSAGGGRGLYSRAHSRSSTRPSSRSSTRTLLIDQDEQQEGLP